MYCTFAWALFLFLCVCASAFMLLLYTFPYPLFLIDIVDTRNSSFVAYVVTHVLSTILMMISFIICARAYAAWTYYRL